MKIRVEQEHIDNGRKGSLFLCPLALALRPKIAFARGLTVTKLCVFWRYAGDPVTLQKRNLPPVAQNFIRAFDAGEPVAPFEVDIQI